jgi:hypothetical protein
LRKIVRSLSRRSKIGGAIIFGMLFSAGIYSLALGRESQLVADDPHPIDRSLPDDIWFSRDGRLIEVGHTARRVWVKEWTPSSVDHPLNESKPLDFAEKFSADPRYSLQLERPQNMLKWVPYTFSVSATRYAWAWNGTLHFHELATASAISVAQLNRSEPVESLAFFSDSKVGVLYADGKLEFWNDRGEKEWYGGTFDGLITLWGRGSRIALSAFREQAGDISVVDPSGPRLEVSSWLGLMDGTAATLSAKGQLAVGTKGGRVRVFSPGHPNASIAVGATPIRALEFYDEATIVAGGDFSGLIQVDLASKASRVLAAASPIHKLAVGLDRIAYASDYVYIAILHKERHFSSATVTLWKIVLPLASVIGLALALIRDKRPQQAP